MQVIGAYFVNSQDEAKELIKTQNERFERFEKTVEKGGLTKAEEFIEKNPDDHFDSIVIFPIKREMTEQEIKEMEDAADAREARWTHEKVAEVFKKTLDQIDPGIRSEALDFLYQHRRAFAQTTMDIRYHCSTAQFDCKIPSSLSLHIAPKYSGMMTKLINARMQKCMLDRNQVEIAPTDGIRCSHRFLAIKKTGKVPANSEALKEMSDEAVYTSFRAVLDVSSLSKYTYRTGSSAPLMMEALARKPFKSITTYLDISAFFYQLRITPRMRSLFCFESSMPGVNWLRLCVLSQGASESSRLSQNVIRKIVDTLNGIEPRKGFDEFIKDLERVEQDQPVDSDPAKLLPLAHLTYIDDIALSTCRDPSDLTRLDLNESSYWRPLTSDREKVILFHLKMLSRVLTSLIRNNLLLSPRKVQLAIEDQPHTFLGIYYHNQIARIPETTRETLKSIKSPQNHRDTMRILGLLNFFSLLYVRLRTKTAFLSSKLRKSSGSCSWSSEDEVRFRALLDDVSNAHMEGMTKLFDVNISPKLCLIHSDWCAQNNTSAVCVLVKYKTSAGEVKTEPAICESKQLPSSYADKSSLLGETAALCTGLLSLRCILEYTPFVVLTDSLSLTYLLARRFDTKVAVDNKMFTRLCVALSNFHFACTFLPSASMEKSADAISRLEVKVGKPIDQFLSDTPNFSDFELADTFLRPYRQDEDIKSFEDRNQRNLEMVKKIETAKGLDEREMIELFSHTHKFPRRLHPTVQQEISAIEQEVDDQSVVDPDVLHWRSSFGFAEPKGVEDIGAEAPMDLIQNEDIVASNEVEVKEELTTDDLFDQTLSSNNVSALTREGIKRLREDTDWICKNKTYRNVLYNPTESLIPEACSRSSKELINYVHEINYVYHHSLSTDQPIPNEPLFTTYDQVRANIAFCQHKSQYH